MSQAEGVVKFIRGAAQSAGAASVVPDAELVRRFVTGRDEQAFRALMSRYGPMVWAVCRRLSRNHHDAEDAFQATLLIFARKAGTLHARAAIGSWLHGVACRVAVRHRSSRRVESAETDPANGPPGGSLDELTVREAEAALHEDLARLPEKYRAPLVLCCLEGLSRDEAATRLGWPANRVKHGLERGRDLLRLRLSRRGVALGIPLLTSVLAPPAGAVPPVLVEAAARLASGSVPPAAVLSLVTGVTRTMWLSKWMGAAVCVTALLLTTGGTIAAILADKAEVPAPTAKAAPAGAPVLPPPAPPKEQKPAWDVAAEFLRLALDSRTDEALKRCVPGAVSSEKIQELRDIGYKEARLTAVLLNDTRAEAVLQKHTPPGGGRKVEGHLILMLVKEAEGPWQVKDIDFRDAERVEAILEDYLAGKYDDTATK
jgi:RNA polymerase sigma factor (sigma-70 family)